MGRKAHPAGGNTRAAKLGLLKASSTTLAPGATRDGQLTLSSVRSGHEATVTVRGELDCASAHLLADELGELLRAGTRRIVVDLAEMTFIDSTGLATLVWALRAAREDGGDLVLRAPRRCARKALAITGADRFFLIT